MVLDLAEGSCDDLIMTHDTCDCCLTRRGRPVCVDENFETYLCNACIRDLRAIGEEVELLEV